MMATSPPASPGLSTGYNYAYLDEGTKRMVRRALLKAVAIPGYQVPVRQPRDAAGAGLGNGRHPDHSRPDRPRRHG